MISIHAPSRERRNSPLLNAYSQQISIHAPSRERPDCCRRDICYNCYFNPRSLTGATDIEFNSFSDAPISIHAPSRERPVRSASAAVLCYFNPRSLTGATMENFNRCKQAEISIHAPSRERPLPSRTGSTLPYFNPRSLTGATRKKPLMMMPWPFQSTLPHGSDRTIVSVSSRR